MNRKPCHDRVRTYPDYLFRQYDSVLRAARYLKSGRFVLVFRQYDGVLRAARKKLSSNPVSGFSQVRCRGILFPIRARLRYVRRRPCGRTPFQILLHSGVSAQKVSKLKFEIRIFSNHFIFPVIPAISRLQAYPLRSHWVWGRGKKEIFSEIIWIWRFEPFAGAAGGNEIFQRVYRKRKFRGCLRPPMIACNMGLSFPFQ